MMTPQEEADDYARRRAQYDRVQQEARQGASDQISNSYQPQGEQSQDMPKEYPRPDTAPSPSPVADYSQFIQPASEDDLPLLPPITQAVFQIQSRPLFEASVLPPPTPVVPIAAPGILMPAAQTIIEPPVSPRITPIVTTIGRRDFPLLCKAFALDISGTSLDLSLGADSSVPLGINALARSFELPGETSRFTIPGGCKLDIFPFQCSLDPCADDASECGGAARSYVNPKNKNEVIYYTGDRIELKYEVKGQGRNGTMIVIPVSASPDISKIAFFSAINCDEGKHCIEWPLLVAPENAGNPYLTAQPGKYLILLSCDSDDGRCEDRLGVQIYDVDYFLRVYQKWYDYFDTAVYGDGAAKVTGSQLVDEYTGAFRYEQPFVAMLKETAKKLRNKYYSDFLKGRHGGRSFRDPCWALTVSTQLAEKWDRDLQVPSSDWGRWLAKVTKHNNALANDTKRTDINLWSWQAREANASECRDEAMRLEETGGLEYALPIAGYNPCCEWEFEEWARTAQETADTYLGWWRQKGSIFKGGVYAIVRRNVLEGARLAEAKGWRRR